MLVRELMIPKPAVITPHTTMPDALKLMQEKKAHRMPVVDPHGAMLGIISMTDLHNASPSSATLLSFWEIPSMLARITVEDLMTKEVFTVNEDATVEEAARIMADNNIGCLPVMEGKHVVGLVNQNDILRAFMEMLGGRRKGVRIWATTPDQKGTVARITAAIAEASGDILGMGFVEVSDVRGSRWEITLKVKDVEKDQLLAAVKPHVLEVLDVREN
jgi:acetoin utilization protein AcuB